MEKQRLNDADQMLAFGSQLSQLLIPGDVVYLNGPLGAGKTTLTQGILSGFGYAGSVKSPTFTLVETYAFNQFELNHFDLYRLADPEELEWIGIREYFTAGNINLIEWPEQGEGFLALPTISIDIAYHASGREVMVSKHADSSGRKNLTVGQ